MAQQVQGANAKTAVQLQADVDKRLDGIDTRLSKDIPDRLTEVEKKIDDLKHTSLWGTLAPSVIAAFAALAGIGVGYVVQDRLQQSRLKQEEKIADAKALQDRNIADSKAAQDRDLAEKQSKLQIGNAVVDWQLKQLSLLYGPVRALLGQSFGLYTQMNVLLEAADPSRFRLIFKNNAKGQNADQGKEFQIRNGEQWERFRTVLHIDQVYGHGFGVETYFDEIVSIGGRIVKIIEQNAGYARPEEKDLMSVFAKYLAHYAVMSHLHGLAHAKLEKSKLASVGGDVEDQKAEKLNVDLSAVFPTELHDLINDGFTAITQDIEHWRQKALA